MENGWVQDRMGGIMDMDLHILNNPNLHPREEVRLEDVAAVLSDDQRRIKVSVEATPFRERPNFEITIRDRAGNTVASTSVIAPMHFKTEYHLHLRGPAAATAQQLTVSVELYYDDMAQPQDQKSLTVDLPAAG